MAGRKKKGKKAAAAAAAAAATEGAAADASTAGLAAAAGLGSLPPPADPAVVRWPAGDDAAAASADPAWLEQYKARRRERYHQALLPAPRPPKPRATAAAGAEGAKGARPVARHLPPIVPAAASKDEP